MRWLAVCAVLVAARVFAQPAPELTKEFQAGVDAFRLGKYDDAKRHLEKARDLDPKLPGPHRFLAAVAQAQQHFDDCIAEARKALVAAPLSPEAPETKKLHDECRIAAGRAPYRGELGDAAAIAVVTNVPGATVKINGLTFGATPLAPRQITAGKLDIEIGKAGWKPAQVAIDAPSGIVTDVVVDLEADPNAKGDVELGVGPAKATTGSIEFPKRWPAAKDRGGGWQTTLSIDGKPSPKWDVELTPGEHTLEIRTEAFERGARMDLWRRRVRIVAGQKLHIEPDLVATAQREHSEHVGLGIVAGGGALLVAGFALHLVSSSADADARDWSRAGSLAATMHTAADITSAQDRASTFGIARDIALGAGVAAIGVGAYLLYKGERQRTDVPPPFYVAPAAHGAVVGKAGAW